MIFNKKLFLNISKICLSLFLIYYIFTKIDATDAVSALKTVDVYFLLIAASIQIMNIPIRSYNWKQLLSVQGIHIPSKTLISITLVGAFFNNFLPTSMGGDVVRAYEISKLSNQTVRSTSTVVLLRLVGLTAIIIYSVIGVIIGYEIIVIKNLAKLVGVLALVPLVSFIIFYNIDKFKFIKTNSKLILRFDTKNIVKKTYNSIDIYKYHKKKCISILLVSLLSECMIIIYFYFIALSLHQRIDLLYFFILIPLISIVEMLPISINGIGVREGAFLYFFTNIGVLGYIAISMSLLYYMHKVGISLIGGIIYALRGSKTKYVS